MRSLALAVALSLSLAGTGVANAAVKTIVLVHGAFADGSGWQPVADILEHDGYKVEIVQEPETSLDEDIKATKLILDKAGPSVLVGHSYGGMVITGAGDHPNARSLVYIAAFEPDVGESAGALQAKTPPASKSIAPIGGGFLAIDQTAFAQDFAPDLPAPVAHHMAISQVPVAIAALGANATVAPWKGKPSYGVVATQDRMINPDLERFMYKRSGAQTIELPSSHVVFLSHPKEVAALIERAAREAN
jgi:pimeloyl-ACP methyl ester carboxylesterase